MFKEGQEVRVIMVDFLPNKENKPKLEMGEVRTIQEICLDSKGNQHLDVGLVSNLNYVTSHETGEELPNGDKIHWCHPSRFEAVKEEETKTE